MKHVLRHVIQKRSMNVLVGVLKDASVQVEKFYGIEIIVSVRQSVQVRIHLVYCRIRHALTKGWRMPDFLKLLLSRK